MCTLCPLVDGEALKLRRLPSSGLTRHLGSASERWVQPVPLCKLDNHWPGIKLHTPQANFDQCQNH